MHTSTAPANCDVIIPLDSVNVHDVIVMLDRPNVGTSSMQIELGDADALSPSTVNDTTHEASSATCRCSSSVFVSFTSRLTESATVILDDVDRPGEREVLNGWQAATPWRFSVDDAAGVAIGRCPPSI